MLFHVTKSVIGGGLGLAVFAFGVFSPFPTLSVAAKKEGPDPERVIALGRKLFYDTTLSTPPGQACVSCHSPLAGFSYPDSATNKATGPVPGALPGRFGFRKPPTAAYSSYLPTGIPTFNMPLNAYTGGLFYDGRATDTSDQAQKPFLNPNEMNNVVHDVGSPDQVVYKVRFGPSGDLFRSVYGQLVFNKPVAAVYALISQSIAAFEASPEVAPFTSKYDAWLEGKANLTPDELEGLRLVTGYVNGRRSGVPNKYNAHCAECHGILADSAKGPDLWTFSCYANLGVPKNPDNPYYRMTDAATDPTGYNALGSNYIDYGLGDFLYPLEGKASGDLAENDPLGIDGTFKTPTLRNVDARPYQGFVKCYMHNGVFKSLQQVVHFYNTRNLTTYPGEVIDFTKPNPYANLKGKPLWPAPEWASPLTMINPQGLPNKENDDKGMDNEQIGNMNMTPTMEAQIVAFLKTLTDGYFTRD